MADQDTKSGRQMVDVEVLQAMYPAEVKGARAGDDLEMTKADTECAQALLELARSFATHHPVNKENNNTDLKSTGDLRSVLNPLSSNKSPPKRKQMHVTVKKLHVGRGSPPKKVRKLGKIDEFSAQEIVNRIKLDHTYALPATAVEYQRQVDPAFYSLLDEVEGREEGNPSKSLVKNNNHTVKMAKVKSAMAKGQGQGAHDFTRPQSEGLECENKRDQHSDILRKSESREAGMSSLNASATGLDADRNGNTKSKSMDLYQPDDSKYKNFNLLLKCLTNEGPNERNSGINSETGSFKRGDTQANDKLEKESIKEEKCNVCGKNFSSKSFLRKHKQHMHSNSEVEAKVNVPESEVCPECSLNVEKKKMDQHRSICCMKQETNNLQSIVNKSLVGASNIATCQFCAVKLRRPLLLKHLADKHCVENKEEGMFSDSGSSTVSGSDVENKCLSSLDEDNIIQCDICFAFVPKPLLSQHVGEKHFNMVSGTGYVAGLNASELPTSEGVSSKTGLELQSQRSSYSSSQDLQDSQDSNFMSPKSTGAFKQYMLQRFLADNSNSPKKESIGTVTTGQQKDSSDVSQVHPDNSQSGLITGMKVSRPNITTPTNTHGIYTVVVTKETTVPRTKPGIQRPNPVEQVQF